MFPVLINDDDRVDDDDHWIGVNEYTNCTCTSVVATNANEIKATTFIDRLLLLLLLLLFLVLFIVNIMISVICCVVLVTNNVSYCKQIM